MWILLFASCCCVRRATGWSTCTKAIPSSQRLSLRILKERDTGLCQTNHNPNYNPKVKGQTGQTNKKTVIYSPSQTLLGLMSFWSEVTSALCDCWWWHKNTDLYFSYNFFICILLTHMHYRDIFPADRHSSWSISVRHPLSLFSVWSFYLWGKLHLVLPSHAQAETGSLV